MDIGELEENVGIGVKANDVPFKHNGGIIRIVAYDTQSIDVFIKAFESAKNDLNDILEYNKNVVDL